MDVGELSPEDLDADDVWDEGLRRASGLTGSFGRENGRRWEDGRNPRTGKEGNGGNPNQVMYDRKYSSEYITSFLSPLGKY